MEVWEEGGRDIIYLHCHHQSESCIKISSDESHFNVSLIVRDKVTRLSTNHNLFQESGETTKRNRAKVLLLTGLTPYR